MVWLALVLLHSRIAHRIEEAAPLIHNGGHEGDQNTPDPPTPPRSFTGRLTEVVHEPLTGLTKVLLVEVLILLLISSVFIGLFAGAQHKLNLRKGHDGGNQGNDGTQTETETKTVTHTTTSPVTFVYATTTTAVSTAVSTIFDITTAIETATKTTTITAVHTSVSTYTTTDHVTHTIIVGPEPTGPPETPQPGPSKVRVTVPRRIANVDLLETNRKSVSPRNASFSPQRSWLRSIPLVIHVRTSSSLLVSRSPAPFCLQR